MVERSELITVCRQIGGMMQAGVDILRITRVLRAQTDNPRLLQLYDALDHDLTMGHSLADALERAPDVWSPFIVSLVQQGEERNDLAGAFLSAADYLLKEGELEASAIASASDSAAEADGATRRNEYSFEHPAQSAQSPAVVSAVVPPESLFAVVEALVARLHSLAVSVLMFATALLLAWAIVWWSAGAGLLPLRWVFFALCSVAALICGVAAVRMQDAIEKRHNDAQFSVSEEGYDHTAHERANSSDQSVAQPDKNGDEVTSPASPLAPPNAQVLVESAAASPGELSAQNGTAGAPTAPACNRTRQVEEDYE